MPRFSLMLALAALLLFSAVTALSEEKTEEEKAIAKMSGLDLYRAYCKICHEPDSPHGEYAPLFLIQEQWERFYDETYLETHEGVVDSTHGELPVMEVISPEMLEKIRKFCIDGAADSEHPMTCG